MKDKINVGIIGTRFMGRAHSQAYQRVAQFFDLTHQPILKAACGLNVENLKKFSQQFGWESQETDYNKLIQRDDIDLIDICTSNDWHFPIALAAIKEGKHIITEKPLALNANEAQQMYEAAETAGVKHMVAFNYRRVPALTLAKQMIANGKIGRIYHFNATYYQDWLVDEHSPYSWRNDSKKSGSGAHGDLNAHIIDLAHFLVGDFEAVSGLQDIFVKERKIASTNNIGIVTADDATLFVARFQCGASGSFCSTRFASGRKNFLRIELFGSEGSLSFNLERMNELEYYNRNDNVNEQGFRLINVTESTHPYMNAWWPAGHIIGWEHTFIHEIRDMVYAIANDTPAYPNFYDGWKCHLVLDAVSQSIKDQKWTKIPS